MLVRLLGSPAQFCVGLSEGQFPVTINTLSFWWRRVGFDPTWRQVTACWGNPLGVDCPHDCPCEAPELRFQRQLQPTRSLWNWKSVKDLGVKLRLPEKRISV